MKMDLVSLKTICTNKNFHDKENISFITENNL